MITKTVKLSNLIERKKDLDKCIRDINSKIMRNNAYNKEVEADKFALKELEVLKESYQEDLITVKEAIAKANTEKLRGWKKPNNYYIYLRSELNRELLHLEKISNNIIYRIKKKFNNIFRLTEDVITERTKNLLTEIQEIDKKLLKFNNTKEVSINVNTTF
jgi:hypothetical protein